MINGKGKEKQNKNGTHAPVRGEGVEKSLGRSHIQ